MRLSVLAQFQSTRPRGARLAGSAVGAAIPAGFNPRARVGRDVLVGIKQRIEFCQFQSTRPRGARPTSPAICCDVRSVSIHAPAWGATEVETLASAIIFVSIHAPAWGATVVVSGIAQVLMSFNPRARVGRDLRKLTGMWCGLRFQSTRPRGARRIFLCLISTIYKFQSTRPRGARPSAFCGAIAFCLISFNPRARVGRDGLRTISSELMTGFNPRARVGRDADNLRIQGEECRFQSTRPRGARLYAI